MLIISILWFYVFLTFCTRFSIIYVEMQLLCVLLKNNIYSINLLFDENCRNVHVVINNVSIPVCFNAEINLQCVN